MSYVGPQAPRIGEATLRNGRPAPPAGSRWWPGTWIRLLVWKWKLGGRVEPAERRGYWFWIPIVVTILVIELLGALSSSFNDAIPWPTISSTVGHLEKRWDWVGIIVVGLITAVAFHAVAYGGPAAEGRALRESGGDIEEWRWYSWPFVVLATGAAIGLAPILALSSRHIRSMRLRGELEVFGSARRFACGLGRTSCSHSVTLRQRRRRWRGTAWPR